MREGQRTDGRELKGVISRQELVVSAQKKELEILRARAEEASAETTAARKELREREVHNAVLEEKLTTTEKMVE